MPNKPKPPLPLWLQHALFPADATRTRDARPSQLPLNRLRADIAPGTQRRLPEEPVPGVERLHGDMRDIITSDSGGMGVFDWVPGLSEVRGIRQAKDLARSGHPAAAALAGTLAILPGGSKLAKSALKLGEREAARYAVLTAENAGGHAMTAEANALRSSQLVERLKRAGYREGVDFHPTVGKYQDPDTGEILHENGFFVNGMPEREAKLIGQEFGQNGVLTHNGYHDLAKGQFFPSRGQTLNPTDIPYTEVQGGPRFALDINWDAPQRPTINAVPVPKRAVPEAMRVAEQMGASPKAVRKVKVDPARAKQMARVYESLPTNEPAAKSAYDALNSEVEQQYRALQDAGYTVEYVDADPYKNSAEMMKDVRENRRLRVLRTNEGSDHPYMTREQNDRFRAVHDFLAHAGGGNEFGPTGEERAFRIHASTLSPEAQRALATETRGQNSWVNFGPNAHLPVTERPFAPQKAALWPEGLLGDYSTMPDAVPLGERPLALGHDNVSEFALPGGDVAFMHHHQPDPETLRVGFMGATGGEGSLGPRTVKDIFRQIIESKPGVRRITGDRISGVRKGEISVPLPR